MLSQTRVTLLSIGIKTGLVNYLGTCWVWGFQGAIKEQEPVTAPAFTVAAGN